jgi:hypothetical protein
VTLTSHISLEDIFSWAINLASRSIPQNRLRRNRRHRVPTPHPNVGLGSPSRNTLSSSDPIIGIVPNRDLPLVNQANPSEPIYPSISAERQIYAPVAVHAPRFAPAPIVEHTSESEETRFVPPRTNELHCYYPEAIYVSNVLPTRTPLELHKFRQHCRTRLENSPAQTGLTLSHPLQHSRSITTTPLNFQNYIWRTRTRISQAGIIEEYHWIRRHSQRGRIDKAVLEPAYQIFYDWRAEGWTVTRSPNNHV